MFLSNSYLTSFFISAVNLKPFQFWWTVVNLGNGRLNKNEWQFSQLPLLPGRHEVFLLIFPETLPYQPKNNPLSLNVSVLLLWPYPGHMFLWLSREGWLWCLPCGHTPEPHQTPAAHPRWVTESLLSPWSQVVFTQASWDIWYLCSLAVFSHDDPGKWVRQTGVIWSNQRPSLIHISSHLEILNKATHYSMLNE